MQSCFITFWSHDMPHAQKNSIVILNLSVGGGGGGGGGGDGD